MEPNVPGVILALIGLVAVATVLGLLLRATQTRVSATTSRRADGVRPGELIDPGTGNDDAGPPEFGERLTLLQFSTETCARCPASARHLAQAAAATEGVRHVEIDVSHRDDLIRRFSILRTPTVLVLDAQHRVHARLTGPVGAQYAHDLVAQHAPAISTTQGSTA